VGKAVKQNMVNRRQNKRFMKRCDIEFVSDGTVYKGISGDFALNGLFIRTRYPKAPGTILDIIIHLPDGSTSKLRGRVMRFRIGTPMQTANNGMGIEITESDARYLDLIRSLLAASGKDWPCRTGIMKQEYKEATPVPRASKCGAGQGDIYGEPQSPSRQAGEKNKTLDDILLEHISKKVKK
jgi:hypothetical protein